ncbi:MAG: hypothetical protein C3F15_15800 [Holophagae bacterium]|nr:MAG: hypothetical protein C3F15_15800 [Holophagae bacterium]
MRRVTMLLVVLIAVAAAPAMAQQTVASTPAAGGAPYGALRPGALIFDQGPATGSNGGCWWNETAGQNFADQATLVDPAEIDEIRVFTCVAPMTGTVHVKILADDGAGTPAGVVYAEDKVPDAWAADPSSGGYVVAVVLTTPFQATAGTTYWYGISYNGQDMGQYSVLTPGDGMMAQFSGSAFSGHATVGDQMFQLMGTIVPVELQSIVVE